MHGLFGFIESCVAFFHAVIVDHAKMTFTEYFKKICCLFEQKKDMQMMQESLKKTILTFQSVELNPLQC